MPKRSQADGAEFRVADWVGLEDALALILESVTPLEPETLPLASVTGRILHSEVRSPIDHPPWDNSAMDGFAVRAEDVRGATRERPVELVVIEEIPAGSFPSLTVDRGGASKIMTGAPMPEGADSVVRVEHTDAWREGAAPEGGALEGAAPEGAWGGAVGERVRIFRDDDASRNVRRRGEDLRRGARVLGAGCWIGPAEAGLLAATGNTEVVVYRKPRVAILSNGDELVEPSEFGRVAEGLGIVNSNSHALVAAIELAGGAAVPLGIARDEEEDIRRRLQPGLELDALVTTAGASVGEHDLLKSVLESLGLRLAFWRVRIRPGSPFSFGTLERPGRRPLPVFGLAGNPVSALVTFHLLVRPALLTMLGRERVLAAAIRVRAAERLDSKPGMVHLLRVRLERDADGGWLARSTGPQGSGILSSMAAADALVVVPEDADGIDAGAVAMALPLRPSEEWAGQAAPG